MKVPRFRSRSLWLRLFGALALFVAAPAIVLVATSDLALRNTISQEIGKSAVGQLKVAHSIETILDDLVKHTCMRISMDPELQSFSSFRRFDAIIGDGDLPFRLRRYLERLDDSVQTNPLLQSIEVVFEDSDYVLSSTRGVVARTAYPDRVWLEEVVGRRGFEGSGTFVSPHRPGDSSPEDLVLSYYFPFPPYLTETRGAVIVHVVEREFSRMVNDSSHGAGGSVALVGSDGLVASHTDKTRIGRPWDEKGTVEGILARGDEGTLVTGDADHLVTWYTPERGLWTYVGDFPLGDLNRNVGAVRLATALLALAVVVVGLALSYVLSRRFFHPVRRLIREVNRRIGTEVEVEGNELNLLSGAFDVLLKRETQLFEDLESQKRQREEEWVRRLLRGEAAWADRPRSLAGRSILAGTMVVDGWVGFAAAYPPDQREYLRSVLLHMAEQAFQPRIACVGALADARSIALVLTTDEADGGAFADLVDEGFDALSAEARRLLGTSITLCLGSRGPASGLVRSWSEAEALVNQRFLLGPGQWHWEENPSVADGTPFFPLKIERSLVTALETRDRQGVSRELAELALVLRGRRGLGYDNVLLILHQIVGAVVKHLVETRVDLTSLFGRDCDLHSPLAAAETLGEALAWLEGILTRILDRTGPETEEGHAAVMVRYIHANFRRDFGVEDVAAEAGLSYSHARKVFEDAMGESIVEHVNALRIAEARRLLSETALGLDEIAAAVGYNNTQSFHRHFRKSVGTTPGEFRIRTGGSPAVRFHDSSKNRG